MDLAESFPGEITIVAFNKIQEGAVGADWAWAFESTDGSRVLPMLVQAKLLDLSDTDYPEIKRHIGKQKPPVRQIDRLISTANKWGWPAIYAFYNHLDDPTRIPQICGSLSLAGAPSLPEAWGISIADAYKVRTKLDDQSFETHKLHSIPFHCLLCSFGTGVRGENGSPGRVLQALRRLRREVEAIEDIPPLPPLLDEMPLIFREAREISSMIQADQRDAHLTQLSQEFPDLSGVVILRDGE